MKILAHFLNLPLLYHKIQQNFRESQNKSTHLTLILFENQIQTTSASPYRTQVQLAASFLVCSLIFIEYNDKSIGKL